MKNDKKNMLFEEQLEKFKHRINYKINESPRYRPLMDIDEKFDEIPDMGNQGENPESDDKTMGNSAPPQTDNNAMTGNVQNSEDTLPASVSPSGKETPVDDNFGDEGGIQSNVDITQNQGVDNIQNEIIKHNIVAMQNIHDKLQGLDMTVQNLNQKLDSLKADVEEVREPSNSEKLMNKTNVSYPYYFNLNDFWSGNWFKEKRNNEGERGMRKLPDGTYIADFDDLPHKSMNDVKNSFNDF